MREYGSVHTCFWTHFAIQSLSNEAKLLALYLLTGPHTNMLGCFRLPTGYISEDLNWCVDSVVQRLEELFQIDFAQYDTSYHWILIPQFLVWNPIENPNQGKSIRRLFEQVPKKIDFFADLMRILLAHDKYLELNFKEQLTHLTSSKKISSSTIKHKVFTPDESSDKSTNFIDPALISSEVDPPIITLTLNDQHEFPIVQKQIDEWQLLYPAVDVLQTLRNIRAWNQANPTRRKTKNGILRHVVAWLAKEQNQASPSEAKKFPPKTLNSVHERNSIIANEWLNPSRTQKVREIDITATEVNP